MAPTALPLEAFTTFRELLKHLRKRAGLTQRELGQAVNYSESHITRLENGSRLPDPAAIKAHFLDALRLQREPEAAQRLIELAQSAHALGEDDEDGVTEAPASPSARSNANNLPAQLTNFIGREREQAEVMRLLGATRLLTLTGAGGVGKTRLALEVASDVVDSYPDGVWLVTLASVTDPHLVPTAVASVFELREGGLPILTVLRDHLHDKRALIVLDNCEHLIHACAKLAEALLLGCPHVRILATSREPLGVPGELTWRVPSMATHEAAQLFEARALDAIPETALTDADAATIATICERLDGIPLAIELAASRLRVYSLNMIAARLDERFKLLTGGARTALPRHQTLRALIDWSYSLLSPDEQRLLRTLSVFAGGWTLEAAESVGSDMDVLTDLPQLVNKSLVTIVERFGQRRYTMLETIRQYAVEKLNEYGEVDVAHERMADYLEKMGQRLGGEKAATWSHREAELDNVRALIGWARAQPDTSTWLRILVDSGVWFFWGYLSEPLLWLTDALNGSPNSLPDLRLKALTLQVRHTYLTGHNFKNRAKLVDDCLFLASQVADKRLVVEPLQWAGLAAWHQEKYDLVVALNRQSYEIAQSLPVYNNNQAVANYYWATGLALMKLNDKIKAKENFAECLRVGREADNGNAMNLGLIGCAWMDAETAAYWCEQELKELRLRGRDEPLVHVLQAYSQSLIINGDFSRAKSTLSECLALWQKLGVQWETSLGSAQALLDLGQVAWLQNDPSSARAWYEQSLDEYSQVGDKERIARLHIYIGLTRLAQGELELAAKDFHIGLNLYRELEQPAGIALALAAQARLAEARGQMEIAARLFGAASVPQEWLAVSILWPASPIIYLREIAEARERFAGTPWMQHWHDGERMTLEQAVAYTLEKLQASHSLLS